MKRSDLHVKLLATYDSKKGKVTAFSISINTTQNRTIDSVDDSNNGLNL